MNARLSEQDEQRRKTIDQRGFRDALGRFATGVTVVTAMQGDTVHGMTANGFMSVSLAPPLVVVSLARQARMHTLLAETGRYGVSVLSCEQEHLSQHFAGRPIDGMSVNFTWVGGIPLIDGSLTHVVASVTDAHPAGDHTLYVGKVEHFAWHGGAPLIFHSGEYQRLVQTSDGGHYAQTWPGFCLDPADPSGMG